jgi:hypothetical protein
MGNKFKDTLFRSLFSDEKAFLSLYNAISGSNYGEDTEVVINTLSETLFTSRKNDVSGLIDGKVIVVAEQQSSPNENMPFRFLSHIARLLENTVVDKAAVYRQSLVKLPRPEFIVLYNGTAEYPDRRTLKLSDAFEQPEGGPANLELTARVVNIGKGRNEELAGKCERLGGYIQFVDIVRSRQAELKRVDPGMKPETLLEKAISYGITRCKQEGILADFFEKLSQEEVNMLATEWNLEDALRVREEETREKTRKETREETREKDRAMVFDIIKQAKSMDELKKMLETSFGELDTRKG